MGDNDSVGSCEDGLATWEPARSNIDLTTFLADPPAAGKDAILKMSDENPKTVKKWIETSASAGIWDVRMSEYDKIKLRCRRGIPYSARCKVWQYLSGSSYILMEESKRKRTKNSLSFYQKLIRMPGSTALNNEILCDIDHTFQEVPMFMAQKDGSRSESTENMYHVLHAWTCYSPNAGYSSAQAALAGVLLMHMPPEAAFWCLVQLCEHYMKDYFNPDMIRLTLDANVLMGLVRKAAPGAYNVLTKHKCHPLLFMTDWFLCLYSKSLPWPTVWRIWDMYLCEGFSVIFKIAVVLIKAVLGSPQAERECPTLADTLYKLQHIPPEYTSPEFLIDEMERLPISICDIETENKKELICHQKKCPDRVVA